MVTARGRVQPRVVRDDGRRLAAVVARARALAGQRRRAGADAALVQAGAAGAQVGGARPGRLVERPVAAPGRAWRARRRRTARPPAPPGRRGRPPRPRGGPCGPCSSRPSEGSSSYVPLQAARRLVARDVDGVHGRATAARRAPGRGASARCATARSSPAGRPRGGRRAARA